MLLCKLCLVPSAFLQHSCFVLKEYSAVSDSYIFPAQSSYFAGRQMALGMSDTAHGIWTRLQNAHIDIQYVVYVVMCNVY